MNIADLINGTFEFGMAWFGWLNVRRLAADQSIEGIHWGTIFWATLWGFWNLFYYPHLLQWFSFLGGCGIVAMNSAWLFGTFILMYHEFRELVRP